MALASGTSHPAQHEQLRPRVPSCPLWCSSAFFCIQQRPARHITGTTWAIVRHRGGGSRKQGDIGHGGDATQSHCTPWHWQPSQTSPCHRTTAHAQPLCTPGNTVGGSPWPPSPALCHATHTGRGYEAIPWGPLARSQARSPTAQADPAHLPGLAPAHRAERKLKPSSVQHATG